ncbi:MAG: hypothetical protein ABIQ02_15360 [Saprospiraceae bacterium]
MKKFIFSFFLFSVMVFSAQAQQASCCKSGAKKSAGCEAKAPSAVSTDNSASAQKVAAMDETIEMRTDPITGSVSYVRKETVSTDGKVTFVSVNFDPVANAFVNVSPSMMAEGTTAAPCAGNGSCAKGARGGKCCCASKVSTTKPEKTKS